LRVIIVLTVILTLVPAAFGSQVLDGILEDALILDASSSRLADYLDMERDVAGSSFKYSNTLSSGDFNINNSDLHFYTIIPLGAKKHTLAISADSSASRFGLSQGLTSFDMSSGSSLVQLFYATRLNDYLDVGIGVNQSHAATDYTQGPGFSWGVRVSPLKTLAIECGQEIIRSGNTAKVSFDGELFLSQAKEGQDNNLRDRAEIAVVFRPDSTFKFCGIMGRNSCEQSVTIDPGDDRYFYAKMGRGTAYSSFGVEYHNSKVGINLDLISSTTNLSSAGGLFGVASPDLVLDGGSIDKTADMASSIRAAGCRIGLASQANDRFKIKTDLSYFKMLFDGSARIWNSWFFGMVQKLDTEYIVPIESADVLMGSFSAKYAINESFGISYSFQQLVPIAVVKKELTGNNDGRDIGSFSGPAVSGGNIQTFSVACYF
jgi:hypothetical protein